MIWLILIVAWCLWAIYEFNEIIKLEARTEAKTERRK